LYWEKTTIKTGEVLDWKWDPQLADIHNKSVELDMADILRFEWR